VVLFRKGWGCGMTGRGESDPRAAQPRQGLRHGRLVIILVLQNRDERSVRIRTARVAVHE
jgi:hypothetical protein